MSRSDKLSYALDIVSKILEGYPITDILGVCQGDFRTASMVGYELAVKIYDQKQTNLKFWVTGTDGLAPYPLWMPARYCGGNMVFGRVFAINHCALSSPDSIVGVRCDTGYVECMPLKGLIPFGRHNEWSLFKLDPASTDDKTGMFYCALEKDFTLEIAHFPNGAPRRIIFELNYF